MNFTPPSLPMATSLGSHWEWRDIKSINSSVGSYSTTAPVPMFAFQLSKWCCGASDCPEPLSVVERERPATSGNRDGCTRSNTCSRHISYTGCTRNWFNLQAALEHYAYCSICNASRTMGTHLVGRARLPRLRARVICLRARLPCLFRLRHLLERYQSGQNLCTKPIQGCVTFENQTHRRWADSICGALAAQMLQLLHTFRSVL